MPKILKTALMALAVVGAFVFVPSPALGGDEPPSVVAARQTFTVEIERPGTFVPAEAHEVELWPEAYSGELLVLEVLPHGTPVRQGDVLARLDTRSIEEQIRQAELDLESAELQHRATAERAEIDEEGANAALDRARISLERAQRAVEAWERYELPFKHRGADMSDRWTRNSIEDQQDELAQLEAMYREDELTDATEEIVLKRARRSLAMALESQKLQQDRRRFEETYNEPLQTRMKVESVEDQQRGLDRLVRTHPLDRMSRRDGIVRSEFGLAQKRARLERLRHDLELFRIVAPRSGVVYHGGIESYEPGTVPPRHERGSRLSTRTPLFTIADPDRYHVALEVPESKIASIRTGIAAKVKPAVSPEREIVGALRVERYPSSRSASRSENAYDAVVRIDEPLAGTYPGTRATVALESEKIESAVVVPKGAVFGSGSDAHVWSAEEGSTEYRKVPVKLGPSNDKEVVIREGVEAGQRLLLSEPAK